MTAPQSAWEVGTEAPAGGDAQLEGVAAANPVVLGKPKHWEMGVQLSQAGCAAFQREEAPTDSLLSEAVTSVEAEQGAEQGAEQRQRPGVEVCKLLCSFGAAAGGHRVLGALCHLTTEKGRRGISSNENAQHLQQTIVDS